MGRKGGDGEWEKEGNEELVEDDNKRNNPILTVFTTGFAVIKREKSKTSK